MWMFVDTHYFYIFFIELGFFCSMIIERIIVIYFVGGWLGGWDVGGWVSKSNKRKRLCNILHSVQIVMNSFKNCRVRKYSETSLARPVKCTEQ